MTPRQIISAHRAVGELAGVVLPYKTARAVFALKKRLREELDTVAGVEKAIVEKHGGEKGANGWRFKDDETARIFFDEYEVFMTDNTEVHLPVVDLSKYTDMLRLSPGAIDALDGIVIFEKEELDNV